LTGILLLITAAYVGGCHLTSNERIEAMQSAVAQYERQSAEVQSQVEIVRQAVADMRAELDNPDIDPEIAAKIKDNIDAAMATADEILQKKAEIDDKVTAWKQKIDAAIETNANLGTELELWGQGLKEISGVTPAPVAVWLSLAGTFLAAIGAGYKSHKTKKAATGMVTSLAPVLTDEQRATLKTTMPTDSKKLVRSVKPL